MDFSCSVTLGQICLSLVDQHLNTLRLLSTINMIDIMEPFEKISVHLNPCLDLSISLCQCVTDASTSVPIVEITLNWD